ncbi:hypothetical protein [Dysgonomonas sp. 25]|uniref:hypothetical protein n=1 Tax=Dysgonomonas sp. 25 TaxID=2302933 RepID=UPI0013D42403|nr:hypothetical protein [Dysgonomonas sp. 25]NDV69739.1 hypothetical protein [Dysgonomonas sp. 25]
MVQQIRKDDYIQRILQEFFAKLNQLYLKRPKAPKEEQKRILQKCFELYRDYYHVERSDSAVEIINLLEDFGLIEQYARILTDEYQTVDIKYDENLRKALSLVEYIEHADATYSWDRTVLKEDILRLLDES